MYSMLLISALFALLVATLGLCIIQYSASTCLCSYPSPVASYYMPWIGFIDMAPCAVQSYDNITARAYEFISATIRHSFHQHASNSAACKKTCSVLGT
ncbi:hypothetical protein J3E68DRAFT_404470 [Trichoderma sp. SZMC 28012]